jgi:hypothetical protein
VFQAFTRLAALTVPIPVAKSQPFVVPYAVPNVVLFVDSTPIVPDGDDIGASRGHAAAMELSSATWRSTGRLSNSCKCSKTKESGTRPRSFAALASGRVFPSSFTSRASSIGIVMSARATSPVAFAVPCNPGQRPSASKAKSSRFGRSPGKRILPKQFGPTT